MGRNHRSSSHQRGRVPHPVLSSKKHRDWRYYQDRTRRGCNPLTACFRCSFGGETAQIILLLFLPFLISILFFLAGFGMLPIWIYKNENGSNQIKLAAQGYKVNGEDSRIRQFLYKPPGWADAINGIPLLLLLHLVQSILLFTYVIFTVAVCIYATQRRREDLHARQAWDKVVRDPKRWEKVICFLLTLATLALSIVDIVIWGRVRARGYDLNPDVLGYFVNIVGLLLCVLWMSVQLAATHEFSPEVYVNGRRTRR